MAGAQIPDNLSPYAGGDTPGASGGHSTKTPRAIPANDLHGPDQGSPGAAIRQDVEGYALGSGNTARREDANQLNDRNTNRGQRGAVVETGRFTDDSSLQVPGSVAPYAGESSTSAARRDADGL